VERQYRRDDLHFVIEAVRKQRPDRAVDEPRGQRLLLGGTALALEEAARDLARGVGLFHVVDREREPVLAELGILGADDGREHHGVVHGAYDRAVRLARDLAGLERDVVVAVAEGFLDRVQRAIPFTDSIYRGVKIKTLTRTVSVSFTAPSEDLLA